MPKKISTLNPGNLIKLNEAGTPIQFIFLEYNHYGNNEVTLLQKRLYDRHQHYLITDVTNARYVDYLDYYCVTQYPLLLDPIIRACLVPVDIIVKTKTHQNVYPEETYYMTYKRSCFAPSAREYGFSEAGYLNEGTPFQYFSSGGSKVAYTRKEAIDGFNEYEDYATRSIGSAYNFVGVIGTTGFRSYNAAVSGETPTYTRLAITLSSDIMISDTVDSDNCYNIVKVPAAENYQKVNGVWMKMV